jgi:hypothetical protein
VRSVIAANWAFTTLPDLNCIKPGSQCDISSFLGTSRSSFSAMTVPCGWRTAVVRNDSHYPYRQRSNTCHELAHCFLGHQWTPPLTESGERVATVASRLERNFWQELC